MGLVWGIVRCTWDPCVETTDRHHVRSSAQERPRAGGGDPGVCTVGGVVGGAEQEMGAAPKRGPGGVGVLPSDARRSSEAGPGVSPRTGTSEAPGGCRWSHTGSDRTAEGSAVGGREAELPQV